MGLPWWGNCCSDPSLYPPKAAVDNSMGTHNHMSIWHHNPLHQPFGTHLHPIHPHTHLQQHPAERLKGFHTEEHWCKMMWSDLHIIHFFTFALKNLYFCTKIVYFCTKNVYFLIKERLLKATAFICLFSLHTLFTTFSKLQSELFSLGPVFCYGSRYFVSTLLTLFPSVSLQSVM